jgi:hypothetical protein
MIMQGVWVLAGAVGTRTLTQVLLRDRNAGIMGYLGNAIGAHLMGLIVGRGLKNPAAGRLVTLGGYVGIAFRLLQDYTPVGRYVQLQLSGATGLRGDIGMGFLEPTTFFVPLNPADGRGATSANMALPSAVTALTPTANLRGVGAMSRYGGRSRYA